MVEKTSKIGYQGKVDIQLKKGNRVLYRSTTHNVGCASLFQFISNCLAGNLYVDKVPQFLMGYENDSTPTSSNLGTKSLSSLIPKSKSEIVMSANEGKARLKFVIPQSMASRDIDVLAIYNDNNPLLISNNLCAFAKLETPITQAQLGMGVNIVVIWEMTIGNSSD